MTNKQKIESFFSKEISCPPLNKLVLPNADKSLNLSLQKLLSRLYLKRFLSACIKSISIIESKQEKESLINNFGLFLELENGVIEKIIIRPEFTSWTMRVLEAIEKKNILQITRLSTYLSSFIISEIISRNINSIKSYEAILRPSTLYSIQFLSAKKEILFLLPLPDILIISIKKDIMFIRFGNENFAISIKRLHDNSHITLDSENRVRVSEMYSIGNIVICRENSFMTEYLPNGLQSRSSEGYLMNETEFSSLCNCLSEGVTLVEQYWPEAYFELMENIQMVLPLKPQGHDPHNETISAFRGLIRTSARPSYLAAQTLIHEMAHNKFNSILDIFTLFKSYEDEYWSPFVKSNRNVFAIMHGIYAFLNDLNISLRLSGNVTEITKLSISEYSIELIKNLEEAINIVSEKISLSVDGVALFSGIQTSFNCILDEYGESNNYKKA